MSQVIVATELTPKSTFETIIELIVPAYSDWSKNLESNHATQTYGKIWHRWMDSLDCVELKKSIQAASTQEHLNSLVKLSKFSLKTNLFSSVKKSRKLSPAFNQILDKTAPAVVGGFEMLWFLLERNLQLILFRNLYNIGCCEQSTYSTKLRVWITDAKKNWAVWYRYK